MDVPVSARENDPLYGYRLWTLSQQIQSKKGRQGCTPSVAAEAVLEAIKAALAYLSSARGQHAEFLGLAEPEIEARRLL